MLIRLETNKSTISFWLLAFFLVTLSVGVGISALFQNSLQIPENIGHRLLFKSSDFENIKKIILQNQLGTFHLKRNYETGKWDISHPRHLPANPKTVQNIINSLSNITIFKIFRLDKINTSHYSLDNPTTVITLVENDNDEQKIKFGLINPVDNSTYITHSSHNDIYHIKTLDNPVETYVLADFIDSKIFSLPSKEISKINIYRGIRKNNFLNLTISKSNNVWHGKNNRKLSEKKINNFFNKLTSLKSHIILDKTSERLEKNLNKYLKNPLYTVEIEDTNNSKTTYIVTSVINSLPEVKIEKRQNFMIKASNRKFPYILNKDFLNLFAQKQRGLL